MEQSHARLMDGTSGLTPLEQIEAEFAKDRWDARKIPGLQYAPHSGDHYIDFQGVPKPFRSFVKDYVRSQLASGRRVPTLRESAYYLGHFLTFFVERYPDAQTLCDLTEQDVDIFITSLRGTINKRGAPMSDGQIGDHMLRLSGFLHYLERCQSEFRPKRPSKSIVWPHHYPKQYRSRQSQQMKYIPQFVLQQLDEHLQHLSPTYMPIVILLRASGWRISDILYLKLASCLEREREQFWLVGDIQKTRVLGHKIPLTKEVAAIVLSQIAWIKQHYGAEENPKGWLFPASKSIRLKNNQRFFHGDPLPANSLNGVLNRFAAKYQIKDERGNIFHFKSHAFRHTKAVELLNNGMSLIMVQQWLAHASPEMTLIYAKMLDETMRKQWEKTVQQGIVQFSDSKPEFVPGKKLLPMASEHGFDPERVREHRQNVKMALGSCLKTAKIMCKFVELPCFHCPAYVLTSEDLPALEAYEQQILERVEIGKQAGNAHWIEVNQKNLDERVRPAIALLKQGHIVAKTDRREREYTDEEWEQRHQEQQEEVHE